MSNNAYKNYLRSRPGASHESVKRVKDINWTTIGISPLFSSMNDSEITKFNFLSQMKEYRPHGVSLKVNLLLILIKRVDIQGFPSPILHSSLSSYSLISI